MRWAGIKKTLVLLALLVATAQTTRAQEFQEIRDAVRDFTLDSGMQFIVLERHEAPVVSFHVYADVGSVNESYGITGISHLLEHMAFMGSRTVGTSDYQSEQALLDKMDVIYDTLTRERDKTRPDSALLASYQRQFEQLRLEARSHVVNNEYEDMLRAQGGAGLNAGTGNDATMYYISLPSNKLEFWMSMASDRFLNPVFREFYKERDVVMEERRMRLESSPFGKLLEDFLATAFKAHPYHHSVVGHMSDLRRLTRADVTGYFAKHYGPSNLTVAIVGDVDTEQVQKLARLYFGRLPQRALPAPVRTTEPEQWGERHVTVKAMSQPIMIMGYHRPATGHPDESALEALVNILGQGRSSRLHQQLVKQERIAVQTGSFNGLPGNKYPNLIAFYAVSSSGHNSQECLAAIDGQIERIKQGGVSDEELMKFKRSYRKGLIGSMKSNSSMASNLAFNQVLLGDWRLFFDDLAQMEAVGARDIQRVAQKYLVQKNRTIGEVVPQQGGE